MTGVRMVQDVLILAQTPVQGDAAGNGEDYDVLASVPDSREPAGPTWTVVDEYDLTDPNRRPW